MLFKLLKITIQLSSTHWVLLVLFVSRGKHPLSATIKREQWSLIVVIKEKTTNFEILGGTGKNYGYARIKIL